MKKYACNRKYDEICKLMRGRGMRIDSTDFDIGGDIVCFNGVWHDFHLIIILNIFNGRFTVVNELSGELMATYASTELDSEPWYRDIIDTLYEPLQN